MRVAIFPGHTGKDTGAVDAISPVMDDLLHTVEAAVTAGIAGRVYNQLEGMGVPVVLCYGGWEARLKASADCTIGVDIHADCFKASGPHGYHCIYHSGSVEGKRLATSLDSAMSVVAERHREPHAESLYLLKNTVFPCVLVEVGFISNPDEEIHLSEPHYQCRLANGITWGILKYLYNGG